MKKLIPWRLTVLSLVLAFALPRVALGTKVCRRLFRSDCDTSSLLDHKGRRLL